MPVVTPSRDSMETVKAVPCSASLRRVIGRKPSSSQRSALSARQISPRAPRAMKLIASGVANCAAITRSPSFSRSSPSQTITMRPARTSASASEIESNGGLISVLVRRWSSCRREWSPAAPPSNRDSESSDRDLLSRRSPPRGRRALGAGSSGSRRGARRERLGCAGGVNRCLLDEQPVQIARGERGGAGTAALDDQPHARLISLDFAEDDRAALGQRVSDHAVAGGHGHAETCRNHQLPHLGALGGVREGRLAATQQPLQVTVHGIARAHHDQRLADQLSRANGRTCRRGAVDGVAAQQLDRVESLRDLVAVEVVDEPEVESPLEQHLVKPLLLHEDDLDLGCWMCLAEGADGRRQEWRGGSADGSKSHHAAALVLLVGGEAQTLGRLDHVEQMRQQLTSLVADRRSRPLAVQQIHAELGLELANRLAQRRLRYVQLFSSPAEGPEARDRGGVFELLDAHRGVASTISIIKLGNSRGSVARDNA